MSINSTSVHQLSRFQLLSLLTACLLIGCNHFDSDEPDTRHNKKHFKNFLKVDITPDVKDIYAYGSDIGIDATYMFAFTCADSTSEKIKLTLDLTLDTITTDYAFGLQPNFEWWNKSEIAKLELYSFEGDHRYFRYYWYNEETGQAYLCDFDM